MMQTGGPLAVHAACTCASSALGVCSAPASVLAASSRASDLGRDGRDMRSDVDGGNHGTDDFPFVRVWYSSGVAQPSHGRAFKL